MNNIKEEQTPQKKYSIWKDIWPGLIVLLIIIITLLIISPYIKYEKEKKLLSECSANLRNLGCQISNYSIDQKGHYPQNLEVLKELDYIDEIPVCPVSGEPYIYEVPNWDSAEFIIFCPNPREHVGEKGPKSVRELLYYYSGSGISSVEPDWNDLLKLKFIVHYYSVDHNGHYPQNLQVLKNQGYVEIFPYHYKYQIEGWDDDDFTIWYPFGKSYYHKGSGLVRER